jgi:hypothetical protein
MHRRKYLWSTTQKNKRHGLLTDIGWLSWHLYALMLNIDIDLQPPYHAVLIPPATASVRCHYLSSSVHQPNTAKFSHDFTTPRFQQKHISSLHLWNTS